MCIIAIDKAVINVTACRDHIWAAIDIHARGVFSLSYSSGISDWVAVALIRKILQLCAGDLVFLEDRGG